MAERLDLDDIRKRWFPHGTPTTYSGWTPHQDIGPLLAEVERLRRLVGEAMVLVSQDLPAHAISRLEEALGGGDV
jgi:hypothetical protein